MLHGKLIRKTQKCLENKIVEYIYDWWIIKLKLSHEIKFCLVIIETYKRLIIINITKWTKRNRKLRHHRQRVGSEAICKTYSRSQCQCHSDKERKRDVNMNSNMKKIVKWKLEWQDPTEKFLNLYTKKIKVRSQNIWRHSEGEFYRIIWRYLFSDPRTLSKSKRIRSS